ncbi:hypothetical protein Tco_0954197 [Tanacetum coccineum]|uniref:Uncharacterized protein n=1 Tax=Tanacetum coccineum TaxID=301880 RepID=A0ABQ5E3K5_9ASTR
MNWRLPLLSFKSVNFSLIAELRANKDASIDTIMNHLRLEDTLAERLDVFHSRVKNQKNIAIHVSELFVVSLIPLFTLCPCGFEGRISLDDFEVTGADDQATTDGNVVDKDADPFPNVDEAELNVSE